MDSISVKTRSVIMITNTIQGHDMIISIIGAGALGKTYGGLLALAGHKVHYLMRSEYAQIKKSGYFNLHFHDPEQTFNIQDPVIHDQAHELPASDIVIIALKTTENHQLMQLLSHCLNKNTIVLVIQNGIGNEEWISQFTKDCALVCGVSTMGATRIDALTVDIPYRGDLKISPFSVQDQEACQVLVDLFNEPLKPQRVVICESYKEIRWHKLIWNVPFATLSIIYSKSTDILASTQPYAAIVRNVINEVVDIAASDGVKIQSDYIEKMLAATQKVKNFYPSMYRDYVEGKAIEKEYILDNVLKIARSHDIQTPMLNLIEANLAANK